MVTDPPCIDQTGIRRLRVGNCLIETDSEGNLCDLADWSEAFAQAQARCERLPLKNEHWQGIHFLREYDLDHGVQAQVRVMTKRFSQVWATDTRHGGTPCSR